MSDRPKRTRRKGFFLSAPDDAGIDSASKSPHARSRARKRTESAEKRETRALESAAKSAADSVGDLSDQQLVSLSTRESVQKNSKLPEFGDFSRQQANLSGSVERLLAEKSSYDVKNPYKLPPKVYKFVLEYIWGDAAGDRIQSAVNAGFSRKRANVQSRNILARKKVKASLALESERLSNSLEYSCNDITLRIQEIAEFNPAVITKKNSSGQYEITLDHLSTGELDKVMPCIRKVRQKVVIDPDTNKRDVYTEFEFYNRKDALDTLAKIKIFDPVERAERAREKERAPTVKPVINVEQMYIEYSEAMDRALAETIDVTPSPPTKSTST
jgi:hypothetical protein